MSEVTGNTADIVKRIEDSHKRLEAELGTSQQLFQQLKTMIAAAGGGSEELEQEGSGVTLKLEEPGSDDVDHQSPPGDCTTPPSSPSSLGQRLQEYLQEEGLLQVQLSLSDESSSLEQSAPVEGTGSGSIGVSSSPEMIAGTSATTFQNFPDRTPRPVPGPAAHGLAESDVKGKKWTCLCGEVFNARSRFRRHCVTKTKGTRDCVCPVADCSAAFFEWRDVTRHLKRTHQLNIYYCKWCENYFESREERDLHMRTDPDCSVDWKEERSNTRN